MPLVIFSSVGGTIVLPDADALLCDRADGGNLVVNPPRPVWERSELSPEDLAHFGALVAAAGRAMIDALPQPARRARKWIPVSREKARQEKGSDHRA